MVSLPWCFDGVISASLLVTLKTCSPLSGPPLVSSLPILSCCLLHFLFDSCGRGEKSLRGCGLHLPPGMEQMCSVKLGEGGVRPVEQVNRKAEWAPGTQNLLN